MITSQKGFKNRAGCSSSTFRFCSGQFLLFEESSWWGFLQWPILLKSWRYGGIIKFFGISGLSRVGGQMVSWVGKGLRGSGFDSCYLKTSFLENMPFLNLFLVSEVRKEWRVKKSYAALINLIRIALKVCAMAEWQCGIRDTTISPTNLYLL